MKTQNKKSKVISEALCLLDEPWIERSLRPQSSPAKECAGSLRALYVLAQKGKKLEQTKITEILLLHRMALAKKLAACERAVEAIEDALCKIEDAYEAGPTVAVKL